MEVENEKINRVKLSENIKSKYILELIFDNLKRNKILKIVK